MVVSKIKAAPRKNQAQLPGFLRGDGMMAQLIQEFDWASTSLGPIDGWLQSLKTSVSVVLHSPVPIVLLWGQDGVMIYNDAYSEFAGARHPHLLGSKVVEGWPEVADFNRNVMEKGLKGETLSYKDQQLTLYRNNVPEEVWMDLNYSPIMNEQGRPAGVMAIVVETTQRVLAEERQKQAESALQYEKDRLQTIFMQAPAFITLLSGPDHIYELANQLHEELVGKGREIIGKPVREALGELADQGIYELLDRVYETGEPYVGNELPVRLARGKDGAIDERYLNFVYQPYHNAEGVVDGIFVHGVDVTPQVIARHRIEDHSAVLEMITSRASLEEVLTFLVKNIEQQSPSMKASVLLLDDDGVHLRHGAAPSLPKAFVKAISGLKIGPRVGSCGTAASRKETVIVSDIATNPLWKDYRDLALRHGLRACWSTPICSGDKVLGTFAMYYPEPTLPTEEDRQIIEFAARTASIAIEQKYAEATIKDSEAKYRSLFTSMDQGFCIIEVIFNRKNKPVDYRFVESNPTFTEHTGLKNPKGKTARELLPSLEEKWFEFYGNIALTGKSDRIVDGSDAMGRWFDVYAFPFGDPGSHRIAVLFTDITERREAEERNLYLATITQNIADAVIATDNDYIITSWNDGARAMYGWSAEEAVGKSAPELIKTQFESRNGQNKPWYDSLKKDGKWQGEVVQFNKEGNPMSVLASVTHLRDSDGNIVGNVAINRDISEEKQAQEEQRKLLIMTEQRNALIKVNRTKDEFIALASHQLRTPATAVKQYIGLLMSEFAGPLTAEQMQYLSVANDSNERELSIINDLLKTAQLDSTKYKLNKKTHNIVDIVSEAIAEVQTALRQRKQTIAFEKPGKIMPAFVDATEVKLVFVNLLENASKYSYPETGIKVGIMQKGGFIEVAITDKGVGISKEDQQRIFDKFTRVNNDLSDTVTGTGLGLYWVKQIVELHRGNVKLNSIPKQGSTFTVRLPHE